MLNKRNDLTFFTNEPDATLLDRFKATLKHVQFFDVLVGYFRTSGFRMMAEALDEVEHTRILVGLNADQSIYQSVQTYQQQTIRVNQSDSARQQFSAEVEREMAETADTVDVELGVNRFLEMLRSGKLEIRAYPHEKIHAKLYIQRHRGYPDQWPDFGRIITGSSNFSYSGLLGNYEFNVELKNRTDVDYALEKFEELWEKGVDLSAEYVETIRTKTWLTDTITPYQLYLKFLYEFFQEEINTDLEELNPFLPEGFMELAYQKQAVISAKRILEEHGGVFLADVVGLGKTYISALLGQQLREGQILVICPPVLKAYWEETMLVFRVPAHVESLGKLDHLLADTAQLQRYKYVFVDEAHRFRNEKTGGFEKLQRICRGKKVILVSATPVNNRIGDILTQLKLFQAPRHSTIPGLPDIETWFGQRQREIDQAKKSADDARKRGDSAEIAQTNAEYLRTIAQIAQQVRSRILHHLMVRRTRHEIKAHFSEDMTQQGLFFPELADPERIVYTFDPATDAVFTRTIERMATFHYARYMPRLYLKAELTLFEAQSQRNIGQFMKTLVVKRLESSFHAFKKTIGRFIASYERFLAMVENGMVYISSKFDVLELLDRDDEAFLQELVDEGSVEAFDRSQFKPELEEELREDLATLRAISADWESVTVDPKLMMLIDALRNNPLLKGQKVILFTESAETGSYLYEQIAQIMPSRAFFFASGGGRHAGQTYKNEEARRKIEANFRPKHASPQDEIQLLITTDVLAEGINLHRSNLIINYDLPWNPTRILQRVGRVNRVGTAHQRIFIFNFFPSSQADEQLGLEANIKAKLQAFHTMLGEDAKYLTEEEEVMQHGMFGARLYELVSRKESYEGESAEERSELEYLKILRALRDHDQAMFQRIRRIPKKARAAWELPRASVKETAHEYTLSFFRLGPIKRFFVTDGRESREVDFFTAIDWLACTAETPALKPIPPLYFAHLEQNKTAFVESQLDPTPAVMPGGGQTNAKKIKPFIRVARQDKRLTDTDEDYLKDVQKALESGSLSANQTQRIHQTLEKRQKQEGGRFGAFSIIAVLRDEIDDLDLYPIVSTRTLPPLAQHEIILSAWLKNNIRPNP